MEGTSAAATTGAPAPNATTNQTSGEQQPTVSRSDPSLLHQITSLQAEKQELLTARRELETRLKEAQDENKKTEERLNTMEEKHKKEKEEFIEVARKEMTKMKNDFLNEWLETLHKQSDNPEVIEKMKTGVEGLIDNGLKKDKMWEFLCCASKANKQNVNTIESLREANTLLSDKNKELEEAIRTSSGFSDGDTRLQKRTRTNDETTSKAASDAVTERAKPAATDVWGQFEQMMTDNARNVY